MEKKILLSLVLAVLAIAASASTRPVECAADVRVYGYTDKLQYLPSETVTLKFWVYNHGPDEVVLKNVTIYCPWYSPVWGGDYTEKNIDAVLSTGKNWSKTYTFTVPPDGRALGGDIEVVIVYTIGPSVYRRTSDIPLEVVKPSYRSVENMDKLLTLVTLQAVLVIVCTIILAATIFLSVRRPKVVLEGELEKTE
ncbi:MAG: hypothetical protein NZ932_00615 [Candidatus Bathyarchaeota archaeon]|nr:hypothetical protein [Candidatus Bathyarchaeota archaeon]MDW8040944.1 hypothetical protein [Nitrososphaerota archaeon]